MKKVRLISKLEVKDHQLVKGVRKEGLRVLGSPIYFAQKYSDDGIDEIIYHDVLASLLGRKALFNLINETAKNIYIPLTVSGGIRSLKDIEKILYSGADRVALNSIVFKDFNIVKNSVKRFGSSTIIKNLDIGLIDGKYFLFTENGKNKKKDNLFDHIKKIQDHGIGEFLINAIHVDGTLNGPDFRLLDYINKVINIPYTYSGGIKCKEDIVKLSEYKNINGIILSSFLHYNYLNKDYRDNIGNTEFLKLKQNKKEVEKTDINKIKKFLRKKKIECR